MLYSESTDVDLIQKHRHRNILSNVWPHIWQPRGPVKLTHEINHHRCSQLIPETYKYVAFHRKMDFADMFDLRNLR